MGNRADIEAGGAFFPLKIREDEGNKAFFNKVAKNFQTLANKINAIGRKMAIGSLIAATPLIAAIRVYANYSKQLAFVATMLDDVEGNMGRFSDGIRKLSVDFGESTDNLSRGLFDILSAGFAPAQAMEMLAITTKAAAAGMTSTKNATQAIIAVLNSYSLSAEHAQEVSDSLFTTMRMGVLTFGELAGHVGLVSSTAAAAGVTMDELGATLATITRGGIETSHAVVALNNILKAFLAPTGAAGEFAKKLESIGLGPVSLQGIKSKGFLNIMKEIAALPADVLTKLFPTLRSQRGVFALKANLAKIDEIYAAFVDKAGSTERAFEKIDASFGHLIDKIKQAGILILSHIGETLAENLDNVADTIFRVAKGFGIWLKGNKEAVVIYAKSVILIGKIGLAMMVLAKVITILSAVTLAFTGNWMALVGGLAIGIGSFVFMEGVLGGLENTLKNIARIGGDISIPADIAGQGNVVSLKQRLAMVKSFARELKAVSDDIKRTGYISVQRGDRDVLGVVGQQAISRAVENLTFSEKTSGKAEQVKRKAFMDALSAEIESSFQAEKKLKNLIKDKATQRKKELDLVKAQTEALKRQSFITRRSGFFAGYYRNPVLSFSSTAASNPELDMLTQIRDNTLGTGSLVTGISDVMREDRRVREEMKD